MDDILKIELIARTICLEAGNDPDLTLGGDGENFWWHEYEKVAEAILNIVRG